MQQELREHVDEYKKNNRKRGVWRKIVQGLACCVVFCTTYALILPAITMKQETFCGQEEHVHTQECYVQDSLAAVLICPLEETEGEIIPTVSGNDAIVFENNLGTEPAAGADSAGGIVPEPAAGAGSEDGIVPEPTGEPVPEQVPHKHTAECYAVPTEYPLTCNLEEGVEHTHSALCYGSWHLICEKAEHSHSLVCFSNPDADVENATVWEQMIASVDLTGEWTGDVVAIAKKQLGYMESTLNYQVLEDGSLSGYTRYGAWSGAPYDEWNTMFAHFCISYAGVESMPFSADCQEWKVALENATLYQAVQEYSPQAGELLFLDENTDGLADRVGIVTEITDATDEVPAQIKSVQGDVDKQVQYVNYDLNDTRILGYGRLPKQPAPVYQYADATVQVEVQMPVDSTVPRNAQLKVTPIGQENTSYAQLLQQAKDAVDGEVTGIQFYDISFYDKNGTYIPVNDWAQVSMTFAGGAVASMEDMVVLHYEENQEAPVQLDTLSAIENVVYASSNGVTGTTSKDAKDATLTFVTHGFSVFAVVDVKQGTYTTRVLSQANLFDLYNYVSSKGSNGLIVTIGNDFLGTGHNKSVLSNEMVLVNEQNTSYDENGNATGTYYSQHERLRSADAATNFSWENLGDTAVVTNADDDLLWKVTTVAGKTDTYYIESVGRPGQYLYIGTDQMLKTTSTPNEIICEVNQEQNRLTIRSGDNYLAYYEQAQKPNQEGITVFGATDGYIGTAESGYNPNSCFFSEYNYESNYTEYITNLDGKIVAIVAVNNDQEPGTNGNPYPAIAAQLTGDGGGLIGADVDSFWIDGSGNPAFSDDDNMGAADSGNRILWEFEATDTPGAYYIKAANYNGTPKNPLAGQYMNIADNGNGQIVLTVSPNKQPLEVVRGYGSQNGDVQNVACIRANINGNYSYVQLGNNYGGWNFGRSIMDGNSNTTSNRANHFVLAQLQSSEMAAVNQVIAMIRDLPTTEEFKEVAGAPTTYVKGFADEIAYRKAKRQAAMEAKAAYDNLSDLQKNFVNQEYTEKLEDLEWLWRPDPNRVPAVDLNATVKVFNYDASVNSNTVNPFADQKGFIFFTTNASYGKSVDGQVPNPEVGAPVVDPLLVNGYPYIETYDRSSPANSLGEGSLQFLFQEGTAYHKGTMSDGGGLFQQDEDGYYYYYSDHNAAWFNGSEFELYDVVVRPEYTLCTATNDQRSNFLPFNPVVGNIIYDHSTEAYDESEPNHNDTVISSVDGEPNQTAYLNAYSDLWFGMSIEYDFFIPKDSQVNGKDMVFDFHGDDDVLVYIDDVLVLNLVGTHPARSGSINFTTGVVTYQVGERSNGDPIMRNTTLEQIFQDAGVSTANMSDGTFADYTKHNLDFYYLERGGNISYAGIKFNLPAIPDDGLWIGKELQSNTPIINAQLEYTFKVVKGENTQESFFEPGHSFMIYENGEYVDSGRVNDDGTFKLKAGQQAMFPDMIATANGQTEFYVQEIIPNNIKDQYNTSYQDDALTTKWPQQITDGDNTIYQSQKYSVEEGEVNHTKTVMYTNAVNNAVLDTLNIKKIAGENTYIDQNQDFRIRVQVGNNDGDVIYLPQGTTYILKDSNGNTVGNGTVTEEGIINLKVGQTATITGFLAGTYWRIEEVLYSGENFAPVYEGTSLNGTSQVTENTGTFGLGDTITFTVKNYAYAYVLNLPISKTAVHNAENVRFNFAVEQGAWEDYDNDGIYQWQRWNDKTSTSIVVTDDSKTDGNIMLGFNSWESGNYAYKIFEQKEDGGFLYDETFYIVKINLVNQNGVPSLQEMTILKNGTEPIDNAATLDFVNYKTRNFTVEKEVVNTSDPNNIDGAFSFEATVMLDGKPYTLIPDSNNGRYTVDHENGVVRFTLQHNESITIPLPEGAVVTVTEAVNTVYTTSHLVMRDGQDPGAIVSSATTGEITIGSENVKVHYINRTGYELPETGGNGAGVYQVGGVLMLLALVGLLFMRVRRKMLQTP